MDLEKEMKLTREENRDIFELLEWDFEHTDKDHRRGSNFWTVGIIKIDEDNYPDIPRELDGYWETNTFISDSEYGTDWEQITRLTKVHKVKKMIEVEKWEPTDD